MVVILLFLVFFLFIPHLAYAWGPGVHMLISFNLLEELKIPGGVFYQIISNNFWEFLYGNLAPDFMVAKKFVSEKNNSHNLDFAYKLFDLSKNEKELSFAIGYLSHLASDKIMHEVFLVDYKAIKPIEHVGMEIMCDAYYSSYLSIAKLVLKKKSTLDKPLKSNVGLAINTFIGKNILKLSAKNIICFLSKSINLNRVDKNTVDAYILASLKLSKIHIAKLINS